MSVIDKPGFYTSKAGKCEVVAIRGIEAVGWIAATGCVWDVRDGKEERCAMGEGAFDITGPYIEPRKPVEAWAVVCNAGNVRELSVSKEASEQYRLTYWGACARLIHLREVEDEKQ